MTGRFSNRGRSGRGGAGRGRQFKEGTAVKKKKKVLTDYYYYLGSAKQASDFETTNEFVINYVKKTYEYGQDIANALTKLEPMDMNKMKPTLKVSESDDAATKVRENKQYDMEFKQDYDEYRKRCRIYENNLVKAYAEVWERCATGMQNKIQARKKFETTINDNPIELLKAVKEHALSFQENRYEMSVVSDSLRMFLNTKQRDNESLVEYTKRYKVSKDVLESHLGGPIFLSKYIEAMPGYDDKDDEKVSWLADKAWDQFTGFVYLENADQGKYGSILTGLNTQKTLGNDQYPKTITEATNVLSEHRFDAQKSGYNKNKRKNNEKKSNDDEKRDDVDESAPLSFAQLEGRCYCCGKPGHKSPTCRHKDTKPKEEWYINKVKKEEGFHQDASVNGQQGREVSVPPSTPTAAMSIVTEPPKESGWCGTHIALQFYQTDELRECILLDNESTTSIFCNKQFVNNIRRVNETMELRTNGGTLMSHHKCDVPSFPGAHDAWFNPKAVTNILSFHEIANLYRITYDNQHKDTFFVHLPRMVMEFTPLENGLYIWKPSKKQGVSMMNSREENRKFYTDREFTRAKKARDFYHAMGTPSINDLLALLRMNLIKNVDITRDDVLLAEKIFGPDVGTIKGKTVRKKPLPVVEDYIEIPRALVQAQRNVTLAIDGVTINSLKFLSTIARKLYYRTMHYIMQRTMESYNTAIDSLVRIYNQGGFLITDIYCDNEFRPLLDPISARHNIQMHYANPQEHVPDAERNNRVIKERVRCIYHRLPFNRIPRALVKYLATEASKKLNFFPAKHGVSRYYSPRMILHQESLDYDKHCRHSIGQYVLAHEEPQPTNTQSARALDGLYLCYNSNEQGGHVILHLATNKVITRRHVTPIPVTPAVIKRVHEIAAADRMPNGLKIATRFGQILYDSTWIAGVDYTSDSDSESDSDDDEDYDPLTDDDDSDYDDNEDGDDDDGYDPVRPNDTNDADTQQDEPPNNPIKQEPREEDEQSTGVDSDEEEEATSEDEDTNPTTIDGNEPEPTTTRSGRQSRPPQRLSLYQLETQKEVHDKHPQAYNLQNARVIATVMMHFVSKANKESTFVQTYSLKAGIRKFGARGSAAADKEMRQLHDRVVWEPIDWNKLTPIERKRAMESLIFLVEKRCGTIKARTCANGSTQREYVERDDAASPTAQTDAIIITAVIDACQGRDVMVADVPNAFVQTPIEQSGEKIIMKIRGILVDMLIEMCPEMYEPYVMQSRGEKILYVRMLKALYGMMVASVLYYKKFRKDIEGIGFIVNPYDPCVANRIINGSQHTITWHVDDTKSSHVDPKVNDKFLQWLEKTYGEDGIGKVKVTRGQRHDYLAMILDFSEPKVLRLDMTEYVSNMIKDFPGKVGTTSCPWTEKLFKVDTESKTLDEERRKTFHTFVMKGMFVCKRARQDIQPAISFLCSRTKEPNEGDWRKLLRVMSFLNKTKDDVMRLEADPSQSVRCHKIKWYVDASFAVHGDMKSHTGATMTLGKGCYTSISTKQKINTRSSTEAELVGVDDVISKILWTKLFLAAQGFAVDTVVERDNTSSMKLEQNGKSSCGKRTRHFDIKYFYITDLIERKQVRIEYCPTDKMDADYMTKPLVGTKFKEFRQRIMNLYHSSKMGSRSVLEMTYLSFNVKMMMI